MANDTQSQREAFSGRSADRSRGDALPAVNLLANLAMRRSSLVRIRKALRVASRGEAVAAVDTVLDHMRDEDGFFIQGHLEAFLSELDRDEYSLLFSQGDSKRRLRRLIAAELELQRLPEVLDPAGVDWPGPVGRAIAGHLDPKTWDPVLRFIDDHYSYVCPDTLLLWQALRGALLRRGRHDCTALQCVDRMHCLVPAWQARMIVAASLAADKSSRSFFAMLETTGLFHDARLREAMAALGREPTVNEAFRDLPIPAQELRELATPTINLRHFGREIHRHLWRYRCTAPLEKAGLLTLFGMSLSDFNTTVIEHASDAETFMETIYAQDLEALGMFLGDQHWNDVTAIVTAADEYLFETRADRDLQWLVAARATVVSHFRRRGIEERFAFPKLYQRSAESSQ